MTSIENELRNKIRQSEMALGQLNDALIRLQDECPEALLIGAPRINIFGYSNGVSITLHDNEHELPELPSRLIALADEDAVAKESYDSSGGELDDTEYFSFTIADVRIDLDRHILRRPDCRKALVQRVEEFCGEPSGDVEVIQWLDD